MKRLIESLKVYRDPKIFAILCLGIFSGLPLALTSSTLSIWLTESGVTKASIGLFAAVSTPYALKFLWSPLIDGINIPIFTKILGRRTAWLITTQLALMAALIGLGFSDPAQNVGLTALFAVCVAFASASQDIVFDAYRVEKLAPSEYGAGSAASVLGYRIGMVIATAGALYLATYCGWKITYMVMAAVMVGGILTVLLSGEPSATKSQDAAASRNPIAWLKEYVIAPFAEFASRPYWLTILALIILYKMGEAFMGAMMNPFYIDIGFSKIEIANIVKLFGIAATIFGAVIGGMMVYRLGLVKALWIGGIAQLSTNFIFIALAQSGANVVLLAGCITLENITGGMGTAAFVALMSQLTNLRFTATQFALLSSLSAFARSWLATPAGWFAQELGWEGFFVLSALLALPGLAMLYRLQSRINLEKTAN